MKHPENCNIKYLGYTEPSSSEEVEFEIMGLENLIKIAEERISMLKQKKYLVDKAVEAGLDRLEDLFREIK